MSWMREELSWHHPLYSLPHGLVQFSQASHKQPTMRDCLQLFSLWLLQTSPQPCTKGWTGCGSLNPSTAEASPYSYLTIYVLKTFASVLYRSNNSWPLSSAPRQPPLEGLPLLSPQFIGQLSRESLWPKGLLARVWLVDSFSRSGILFDMSFKSFKELGVSAERLGSFCKRWMGRVPRSGFYSLFHTCPICLCPSFCSSFYWALCVGISVVN